MFRFYNDKNIEIVDYISKKESKYLKRKHRKTRHDLFRRKLQKGIDYD